MCGTLSGRPAGRSCMGRTLTHSVQSTHAPGRRHRTSMPSVTCTRRQQHTGSKASHERLFQCDVGHETVQCRLSFVLVPENQIETSSEGQGSGSVPQALAAADAIMLFYDVYNRLTFFGIPELLDAFQDIQVPKALLGCNADDAGTSARQIDGRLGQKLAAVFGVFFAEVGSSPRAQRDGMELACQQVLLAVMGPKGAAAEHSIQVPALATRIGQASMSGDQDQNADALKVQLRTMRRLSAQLQQRSVPVPLPESISPNSTRSIQNMALNASGAINVGEAVGLQTTGHRARHRHNLSLETGSIRAATHALLPQETSTLSACPSAQTFPFLSSDDAKASENDSILANSAISKTKRASESPSNRSSIGASNNSLSGDRRSVFDGFSVTELVERLTSADAHDMEFTKVFLIFYPRFLRPSELLDRLLDRFDTSSIARSSSIHAVQLRVCNVIINWATDYWCDFQSEKMRFTLLVFLEICASRPPLAAISQRLARLVFPSASKASNAEDDEMDWGLPDTDDDDALILGDGQAATQAALDALRKQDKGDGAPSQTGHAVALSATPFTGPDPSRLSIAHISRSFSRAKATFLLSSCALWNGTCLSRSRRPRDLVHHIWSKSKKGKHARSVAQSVELFNATSTWVTTSILSENEPKSRAKIMAKFMRVSQWLRAYGNYNSLMAVIAGINNSAVARLKQTRQHVLDRQGFAEFADLERLMSSEKSFAHYRTALKQSSLPCVPYLGVFLRDLLYIDEANKDYKADGTVNLHKFVLMGDVVLMIRNFQIRSYNAKRNDEEASCLRLCLLADAAICSRL
ncbi:ras guanine nucleotide exchange factor domain-containing protein [Entophlyctis helioformis]|nr:ras guanine nucleotide exchange factor domain-containing protein [Entophlyctis helioformis]